VRPQFADVRDHLIDLRVAENRTERKHRARLAVVDTDAESSSRFVSMSYGPCQQRGHRRIDSDRSGISALAK
jgi:hypothetical protein